MIQLEHKKVGKYIMLTNRKVAQLKNSTVYMGLNTQNKKKILIKVISRTQYESNDVLKNSFNFQIDTMKKLREENILKAIELITTENNLYLVLEEPQGDSMKKIVSKNGPFKEKKLRAYIKTLRRTIEALQKNKIIHGNINSKSVLIHHNQAKLGYPSYVKTIEVLKSNSLGSAELMCDDNLQKQKDYSYLPPELLSSGEISLKHDIWSFGVVMYETLFDNLPWNLDDCNSTFEMATLIENQTIQFPESQNISKQMLHFLNGCLETDAEKRFSWVDVLEHPIFNQDVESVEQNNFKEDQHSLEQTQVFLWSGLRKEAKSNSTLTE